MGTSIVAISTMTGHRVSANLNWAAEKGRGSNKKEHI